jgi:hypothetical protein
MRSLACTRVRESESVRFLRQATPRPSATEIALSLRAGSIAEVEPESVLAFIAGTGPVTARWMENHRVLGGFYRYAVGRGFAAISPLPTTPSPPTQLTPYVYTEVGRIFPWRAAQMLRFSLWHAKNVGM